MARREFPKPVYIEIVKRATREIKPGLRVVHCESCGRPAKVFHVDHTNPDALQIDKSRRLTADDGKVLCAGSPESCHGTKTAQDQANIAKAKRVEAKHLRKPVGPDRKIQGPPMATTAKAAQRAERGHKPALAWRIPEGFEPATARKS